MSRPESTGFSASYRALKHAQKGNKGGPAYSRYVNRPVGRVFAAAGFVLGRTPNQVTLISAAFTFAGIALIGVVRPTVLVAVAAAVLLLIGYALDSADGQLARLQGVSSLTGEWLDHTVDATKIAVLHLAVLVSWYRFEDVDDWMYFVPLAFQAVTSVHFFSMVLMDQMRRAQPPDVRSRRGTNSSARYSLAVLPTDYGLLCVVLALRFEFDAFLPVYAALGVLSLLFLMAALPKWFIETRSFK